MGRGSKYRKELPLSIAVEAFEEKWHERDGEGTGG
jgi:hypothetical protein